MLTPCREWSGPTNDRGYGTLRVGGQKVYVHRRVVALVDGEEAIKGRVVMHLCDNPPCFRYDHLRIGTKADNSADMAEKRRSTWGERNPNAVLVESDVIEILELFDGGANPRLIAERFGVTTSNVFAIGRRRSWKHLGCPAWGGNLDEAPVVFGKDAMLGSSHG